VTKQYMNPALGHQHLYE